jgi:hypothetical protein
MAFGIGPNNRTPFIANNEKVKLVALFIVSPNVSIQFLANDFDGANSANLFLINSHSLVTDSMISFEISFFIIEIILIYGKRKHRNR